LVGHLVRRLALGACGFAESLEQSREGRELVPVETGREVLVGPAFSGERAPELPNADSVSQEAYSHELISFGFWPGDQKVRMAAFYAYTAPKPAGLAEQPLRPEAASWQQPFGSSHLALLAYEEARNSPDPRGTLLEFLQSAYEAGAGTADWDADGLRSSWCPPVTVSDSRPGMSQPDSQSASQKGPQRPKKEKEA
jgi:Family of unknown function (DUF5996)